MIRENPYKDEDWPADRTESRMIKIGQPDHLRRIRFDILWWQDDRRRAQSFFSLPDGTEFRRKAKVWEDKA